MACGEFLSLSCQGENCARQFCELFPLSIKDGRSGGVINTCRLMYSLGLSIYILCQQLALTRKRERGFMTRRRADLPHEISTNYVMILLLLQALRRLHRVPLCIFATGQLFA